MKRWASRSMPRQDATEIGVVPAGAGDDREQREALPRRRRLAAALTTSRATRERITPNRSTWRGWVSIITMIAWKNIACPS
jgi:hypothetical protein